MAISLRGETIVCLSPTSWFDIWRNRQQVMSRLAAENRILFVEPQRTFTEPAQTRINQARPLPTNLVLVEPPVGMPFGASFLPEVIVRFLSPFIVEINNARLARFLREYLAIHQVQAPILWLYDPLHVGLVGKVVERLVVYHAHDDTSIFPFNHKIRQIVVQSRRQLLAKADVVFECSLPAFETERQSYGRVYYVPNGVDILHFQKSLDPTTVIPADLDAIPRPIIGFYGGIDFRLDLDLLRFVARARPKWSLVLVGNNTLDRYHQHLDLDLFSNLYILGPREYQVLPNYLKAFDVVIWPYIATESVSIASTPLKLYECLAAGKPIVTVELPIQSGRDLVYMARTPGEFVAKIEEAIYHRNDADQIERGIALARENTWDKRVEQMSTLIEEALRNRGDGR